MVLSEESRMRKNKTWAVYLFNQNAEFDKSGSEQIQSNNFYTSDTEAYLNFTTNEGFEFDSATIAILNKDSGSIFERPMVKEDNTAVYKIESDVIQHFGLCQAQVLFKKGEEIFTSMPVTFDIERYMMADRPTRVEDVISWKTLYENATETILQFNDVIKELSEEKDFYSLPEIAGARGGFDTLGERLKDTDTKLSQTKQAFNDSVSKVTVDSEVILARGTKTTLGERVDEIDDNVEVIRGKNYLKGVDLIDGYFINDPNGELVELAAHSVTDFISLDSGQQYVLSNTAGGVFTNSRILFYDESNTFINGYRINGGAQIEEAEFTVPNNASKARISLQKSASPDYSTWNIRRKDFKVVTTLNLDELRPKLTAGGGLNLVNNKLQLDKYYGSKDIFEEGDLDTFDGEGTHLYVKTAGKELLNGPPLPTSFALNVMRAPGGWITQIARDMWSSTTYERKLRITDSKGGEVLSPWRPVGIIDRIPHISETGDLDDFYTTGNAVAINPINAPEANGKAWAVVNQEVRSTNQNIHYWTVQTVTEIRPSKGTPPSVYSRIMQIRDGKLLSVGSYTRLDNAPAPLDFFKDNGMRESGDLNDFTDNGVYLLVQSATTPLANKPFPSSGVLMVFKTYGSWTVQMAAENATGKFYHRVFRHRNDGGIDNQSDWIEHGAGSTIVTGGTSSLAGETWVNLGDSIFGNNNGSTSVSNQIANKTGAEVINIGYGGSRVAQHASNWDPFSFYRLAEEIVKDDTDPTKWALQDASITKRQNGEISGMPAYFDKHLEDLKAINWLEVDGVTVAGGTNDYTAQIPTDNIENPEDTNTYAGALRYGMRLLMSKHPHLKVLLCTPMYRFWRDSEGNVIDDSDTRAYADQTLPDFVEKAKEVGKELKIPVLDNYFELGINQFNRDLYFPPTDGTHPNAEGNRKLGYKIGSALIREF